MALIDLTSYKIDLMKSIITNSTIINLIDSKQPEYIKDEPDSILNVNVFAFDYIPDVQAIADCYLLIDCAVERPNPQNEYFNNMETSIRILCHQTRMRVSSKSGTRIDLLAFELGKMLDGRLGFGFGELQLQTSTPGSLNDTYKYRSLLFKNLDAKESKYNIKYGG